MIEARDLYETLQRAGLISWDEPYGCINIEAQRKWEQAAASLVVESDDDHEECNCHCTACLECEDAA